VLAVSVASLLMLYLDSGAAKISAETARHDAMLNTLDEELSELKQNLGGIWQETFALTADERKTFVDLLKAKIESIPSANLLEAIESTRLSQGALV